MSTIAEEKAALRAAVRAKLDAMSDQERRVSDDALFRRFLELPQVKNARTIFAFWGMHVREPDTGRLVELLTAAGKRVALPRTMPQRQMELRQFTTKERMAAGPYGIREPDGSCPLIAPEEIDLVMIPAVCCDKQGMRLGQGGGYYDRWLEAHPCPTVCMCRDAVLQDKVPTEAHDCPVDVVLTETRILP